MFDKDEDGKLTEDELREIMLQMGDRPISEEEFENFITVIIKHRAIQEIPCKVHTVIYLRIWDILELNLMPFCFIQLIMNLSILLLSTLFQCFPVDSEGLHDYKGNISQFES